MLQDEKESTDLKLYSLNSCSRCGNDYKKKLLLFDNKKECFICNRTICSDCLSREERYDPVLAKKGYTCLDCYPKTKISSSSSSLFPGVMDINSAVESIENKIPDHLGNISSKLNQIDDIKVCLDNVIASIQNLITTINFHVDDVKKYSETFTQRNWKIIKKDIYLIITFAGIGIIILSSIITLQVMLFIKYIYPLL